MREEFAFTVCACVCVCVVIIESDAALVSFFSSFPPPPPLLLRTTFLTVAESFLTVFSPLSYLQKK